MSKTDDKLPPKKEGLDRHGNFRRDPSGSAKAIVEEKVKKKELSKLKTAQIKTTKKKALEILAKAREEPNLQKQNVLIKKAKELFRVVRRFYRLNKSLTKSVNYSKDQIQNADQKAVDDMALKKANGLLKRIDENKHHKQFSEKTIKRMRHQIDELLSYPRRAMLDQIDRKNQKGKAGKLAEDLLVESKRDGLQGKALRKVQKQVKKLYVHPVSQIKKLKKLKTDEIYKEGQKKAVELCKEAKLAKGLSEMKFKEKLCHLYTSQPQKMMKCKSKIEAQDKHLDEVPAECVRHVKRSFDNKSCELLQDAHNEFNVVKQKLGISAFAEVPNDIESISFLAKIPKTNVGGKDQQTRMVTEKVKNEFSSAIESQVSQKFESIKDMLEVFINKFVKMKFNGDEFLGIDVQKVQNNKEVDKELQLKQINQVFEQFYHTPKVFETKNPIKGKQSKIVSKKQIIIADQPVINTKQELEENKQEQLNDSFNHENFKEGIQKLAHEKLLDEKRIVKDSQEILVQNLADKKSEALPEDIVIRDYKSSSGGLEDEPMAQTQADLLVHENLRNKIKIKMKLRQQNKLSEYFLTIGS